MAVIAALEFYNLIAARKATGDAQGTHGGFCAGVDHAQPFDRRVDFFDQVGQL